jgi:hypothetical protein
MTDKKPAEEAAREFRKSGKGGNGCPCDEVHTMDIELAALMTTREAELRAEVERLRKQNHEAAGERDKRYAAEMKELGHCRSLLREAKEMHEADMAHVERVLQVLEIVAVAVVGIDLEQALNYIDMDLVGEEFIYSHYTSRRLFYTRGSRPGGSDSISTNHPPDCAPAR